jgi:hypothetical protein
VRAGAGHWRCCRVCSWHARTCVRPQGCARPHPRAGAHAAIFSSCCQYKEKHKEQLGDRLGAGAEREQAEYRKMLDAERNRKVRPMSCSPWILVLQPDR